MELDSVVQKNRLKVVAFRLLGAVLGGLAGLAVDFTTGFSLKIPAFLIGAVMGVLAGTMFGAIKAKRSQAQAK